MRNTFRKILPILLAATFGLVAMGSAQAQPQPTPPIAANAGQVPVARANPGVSQAVIDSLPAVVQASNVHIDSSYKPGMLIYHTDGTLVAGQGSAAIAAAWLCNQQVWGPPWTWGPASVCGGVVWGSPGWSQGYAWSSAVGVFTSGCVQGRGQQSGSSDLVRPFVRDRRWRYRSVGQRPWKPSCPCHVRGGPRRVHGELGVVEQLAWR